MARAKQTVSQTKTRVKKNGSGDGEYQQCRICHGTGIQRVPRKKK